VELRRHDGLSPVGQVTTIAIVSSLYGGEYDVFVPDWYEALENMVRQPDEIILHRGERQPGELYPEARLQNEAAERVTADWIWQLNVDDLALPDALVGIDLVASDVWLMGFRRDDGEQYIPTVLPNHEYLSLESNPYPSMSAFRLQAFDDVDGYPMIAHEDWGMWRRMARAGCTFHSSGRVHSTYQTHPLQRTATELLTGDSEKMLREVMDDA
jgi:hypothetical protein